MSQSTHPSTELLAGYIDSPDSNEFGALRQHLINCTECRNKTMKLTKLNYNITHHLPRLLEPNEANELKSALHFATHSAAMNRHLNSATNKEFTQHFVQEVVQEGFQNNAPKPNDDSSAGFIEQITNFLTIRPPVWASVPVTAAIVFSLTMVLLPVSDKSDETDTSIAAYQDNPVIIFNKSEQVIPGIVFFNNANQKKEAFNSISISLKKDSSLHIE
ncbi:MAG: hypothetical protein GXP19_08345 [Gammaproteobacteria bacterium]|nr:hypothetical protein [Gammaproteobacteria bacterium]